MIGKVLAVAGIALGGYTAVDKLQSGKFWWEKPPFATVQRQVPIQMQVQNAVKMELANRERLRLAREKQASSTGRYATQSCWNQQQTPTNYGLTHY